MELSRVGTGAPSGFYGYTAGEIIGRPISVLVPAEGLEELGKIMARLKAGGAVEHFETTRLHKDGHLISVALTVSPIKDTGGRIVGASTIARDITRRKQAAEALKKSHAQLRALSARLQSVREKEATRMARQIHDDLGQKLTALNMDLHWMERKLGEMAASEAANSLLDRVVGSTELVDSVTTAVQRIAADLRPGALDNLGLGPALQFEARRFEERTGILCKVRLPEAEPALTTPQATALFRMFEESLTNVARHAGARTVEVELRLEAGACILTVQDDGRGITEADIARPESLGLLGMRERAKLWAARLPFNGIRAGRELW